MCNHFLIRQMKFEKSINQMNIKENTKPVIKKGDVVFIQNEYKSNHILFTLISCVEKVDIICWVDPLLKSCGVNGFHHFEQLKKHLILNQNLSTLVIADDNEFIKFYHSLLDKNILSNTIIFLFTDFVSLEVSNETNSLESTQLKVPWKTDFLKSNPFSKIFDVVCSESKLHVFQKVFGFDLSSQIFQKREKCDWIIRMCNQNEYSEIYTLVDSTNENQYSLNLINHSKNWNKNNGIDTKETHQSTKFEKQLDYCLKKISEIEIFTLFLMHSRVKPNTNKFVPFEKFLCEFKIFCERESFSTFKDYTLSQIHMIWKQIFDTYKMEIVDQKCECFGKTKIQKCVLGIELLEEFDDDE